MHLEAREWLLRGCSPLSEPIIPKPGLIRRCLDYVVSKIIFRNSVTMIVWVLSQPLVAVLSIGLVVASYSYSNVWLLLPASLIGSFVCYFCMAIYEIRKSRIFYMPGG